MAPKYIKDRKKAITDYLNANIGDMGYLDFQAKNCKILEIYDLYTSEKINDTIPIIGVYAARDMESIKRKRLNDKDFDKVHKIASRRNSEFNISRRKAGDVEIYPTFMSTYWDATDDHTVIDISGKVVDSDERDRDEFANLNNIPDLIGDLEAKGFHVSDEEVKAFLVKYRKDEKWIPDTLSHDLKNGSKDGSKNNSNDVNRKFKESKPWELNVFGDTLFTESSPLTEEVGDADDMRPESDHPVRDTLYDIDQGLAKTQQAAKKKVQGVVGAGQVFMKPIKRTHQWVTKLCAEWKDKDENKIKERMADPHARNNLFSAIKWSIKTGSFLKAGLLLNPVFLFLSITKKAGKKKNERRLRDEMIGELKTELEVINEKIKDADGKDNKAKYKLMRLRNTINKKLAVVGGQTLGGTVSKKWDKLL